MGAIKAASPFTVQFFEEGELPGDFSSSSRFIRAALLRQSITKASDESEGIREVFKVLDNVSVKEEASEYCTLYKTAMCANSGNYYVITYENNQLTYFITFTHNTANKSKDFK